MARGTRSPPAYSAISMFAGCGGMDVGAEATGRVRVLWANDVDPAACATYRRNLGDRIEEGDIRDIEPPALPCDILIAGPPCQDFSVLWLHEGARTARGNLYFETLRFLAAMKPAAFVLENVKGLLSANAGEAWTLIRAGLKAPGRALGTGTGIYPRYDLSVSVVNFADLGVPQMRERLIVIGTRQDLALGSIDIGRPFAGRHQTVEQALDLNPLPPFGEANHDLHEDTPDVTARLKLIAPGENYTAVPEGHPLAVKGLISHVYRRLHPDRPAYTVVAGGGGGSMGYHHREPRSITNRERARLQTFSDDFIFEGSIREIRSQVGNAVPPRAAELIVGAVVDRLAEAGIRPQPGAPRRRSTQTRAAA
jgi:DNA (cytosine-5)-methyltransferase 1